MDGFIDVVTEVGPGAVVKGVISGTLRMAIPAMLADKVGCGLFLNIFKCLAKILIYVYQLPSTVILGFHFQKKPASKPKSAQSSYGYGGGYGGGYAQQGYYGGYQQQGYY